MKDDSVVEYIYIYLEKNEIKVKIQINYYCESAS